MSDIVERLEACLDIPEVPSSVCRAISEAADLIISLRAIVATPKPEAEPVGYVTKNEFTQLRLGASCVDLFGKVVPTGFEMVPLYAHPPKPEATEGGAHEKGIEAAHEALWDRSSAVCSQDDITAAISSYLEASGLVLVPTKMTAAMINAWSGGISVTSDAVAYHTPFQGAWQRVLAAAPSPVLGNEKEGSDAV